MGLNVERFLRVKEMILEEPARMDMGTWQTTNMQNRENRPACGTAGCIAGWAAITFIMEKYKLKRPKTAAGKLSALSLQDIAEEALGMGDRNSWWLFDESNWPEDLYTELSENRPGTPAYAAVVAQAIDRYLACDGNWDNDKGAA